MSEEIAKQWLQGAVDSSGQKDLETHEQIKSIAYKGFNLISATDTTIMFSVFEAVVGSDGALNEQIVEMTLEKEDDGVWRLVQERVLIENDAMRDHEVLKD